MYKFVVSLFALLSLIYLLSLNVHAEENVFLGDSRTVGLYLATHDINYSMREVDVTDKYNNYWHCKCSMGYDYMHDEVFPDVINHIEDDTNIIIWFGVNDCANSELTKSYNDVITDYSKVWNSKGANVYYVTLGPVRECKNVSVTNKDVSDWNNSMIDLFNKDDYLIINLYKNFVDWHFADNLHYTRDCSKDIYNFITMKVNERNSFKK